MESVPSSGALCGGGGYPDSVDSSPRSRGGDSWDDPYPSTATAAARLRLMCSYGGRIVPRPTDKSLCYLGGETRIVVVDRHASLADLHSHLSRTLLGGRPFSLKYQLPNEDLDSLISVSTDEDLENMVDEYDRIVASKPEVGAGGSSRSSSRIRLFLFPSKMDSSSSIGSLLDDSTKSETWFVDALNSAMGLGSIDGLPRGISAESASVNCLLGLEEDDSTHSRTSAATRGAVGAGNGNGDPKLTRQDVQYSVPDSPNIDKLSSFGSTSSAPSLSNLPPIRVRADDRPQDHRIPAIEPHFAHMTLSSGADPPQIHAAPPPTQLPTTIPIASAPIPALSSSDNPNRFSSDDDDKSDHGGSRKHQQPNPATFDGPLSDSSNRQAYYQERPSSGEQKRELPVSADASYRTQVPTPDAGYVYPPQMQPPQPQFVPANAHYIQHTPTGTFVPMPSYYPIQQPQQSHQLPMYFLPVPQNVLQNPSPYNLSAMQPPLADPTTGKPELPPANLYRTTAMAPAQATSPAILQPAPTTAYPGMGYHLVHPLHHPSQSPATVANYTYEFADPACTQMYYTQTTSPPSVAPQYQTMGSAAPQVTDVGLVDMKQTRAS